MEIIEFISFWGWYIRTSKIEYLEVTTHNYNDEETKHLCNIETDNNTYDEKFGTRKEAETRLEQIMDKLVWKTKTDPKEKKERKETLKEIWEKEHIKGLWKEKALKILGTDWNEKNFKKFVDKVKKVWREKAIEEIKTFIDIAKWIETLLSKIFKND